MKKRMFAGLLAGAVLAAASAIPAQASCRDGGNCGSSRKDTAKPAHSHIKSAKKHGSRRQHHTNTASIVRHTRHRSAAAGQPGLAVQGRVVSLIEAMAPAQGVPTWFALRIAKVESNYNPAKRGAAGEYGVFQIKCATAKGIGYSGDCGGLADARTNVQWGLKHLALAISASDGNLKLAASKHNGGLGRRTQIATYVAKVF